MIGDVVHQRQDELNAKATYLPPGGVKLQVRNWPGQEVEGDTSVNELNEKVLRLIPPTAHLHFATAVGIRIEANICQCFFDGEFDLRDARLGKAGSDGTLYH
jgi:hypothetical protein